MKIYMLHCLHCYLTSVNSSLHWWPGISRPTAEPLGLETHISLHHILKHPHITGPLVLGADPPLMCNQWGTSQDFGVVPFLDPVRVSILLQAASEVPDLGSLLPSLPGCCSSLLIDLHLFPRSTRSYTSHQPENQWPPSLCFVCTKNRCISGNFTTM